MLEWESQTQNHDGPRMDKDPKFVVVHTKQLRKEWNELVQKSFPSTINKLPAASNEVKKTIAWRYWTQQTRAEMAKYTRGNTGTDLIVKITKRIGHGEIRGMWFTYHLKEVPSAPFLERVGFYRGTSLIEFCFPSFLRMSFIQAYGAELGITPDLVNMQDLVDDDEDEYYTPKLKVRFTPNGWNKHDAPKQYWELEEIEIFRVSKNRNDIIAANNFYHWHKNVRQYGRDAHEVKHLWGDVYELKMFYTWGSSSSDDNNNNKVTTTSKVNARTGKIISVRVTNNDDFDGDIDERNQLKVLTDKFTPDNYVYGFKVAKTMKGEPCIAKLMIPRGAKVACNVNDAKIRTDQAWVVGIFKFEYDAPSRTVIYGDQISVAQSFYYKENVNRDAAEFLYRVGDHLQIHNFEPDLGKVCVPGVHFYFSQKQLFHLIKKDVTDWVSEPEFIKGYKRVLGLKFQSRSDILKQAFAKSESSE